MLLLTRLRPDLPRLAVALLVCGAAAGGLPAAADAAAKPRTCASPPLSSRILETPRLMLTYAELERERKRSDDIRTRSCWRGSRRPHLLGRTFDVNFVSGGVTPLRLVAGRWLLVEDWESSSSEEGSQSSETRRLFDARTKRSTESVGADAVAGPPGLLGRSGEALVLRVPGRAARQVALAVDAGSLALGERTAYWSDGAGTAFAAAVPTQLRPAKEPKGRPSPRDAHGPCEPRGSRTLVRLAGGRIYANRRGFPFACAGRSKRTISVYDVPNSGPLALAAEEYTVLDERHVAFRQELVAGEKRFKYVVLDLPNARVLHVAVSDGAFTGAAATADGILMADGAGVRWVTRRSSKVLSPAGGTDPAVAAPFTLDDPEATPLPARAYWTTPEGPRSAPLG